MANTLIANYTTALLNDAISQIFKLLLNYLL